MAIELTRYMGSGDGDTVTRALGLHKCGLGSIPGIVLGAGAPFFKTVRTFQIDPEFKGLQVCQS